MLNNRLRDNGHAGSKRTAREEEEEESGLSGPSPEKKRIATEPDAASKAILLEAKTKQLCERFGFVDPLPVPLPLACVDKKTCPDYLEPKDLEFIRGWGMIWKQHRELFGERGALLDADSPDAEIRQRHRKSVALITNWIVETNHFVLAQPFSDSPGPHHRMIVETLLSLGDRYIPLARRYVLSVLATDQQLYVRIVVLRGLVRLERVTLEFLAPLCWPFTDIGFDPCRSFVVLVLFAKWFSLPPSKRPAMPSDAMESGFDRLEAELKLYDRWPDDRRHVAARLFGVPLFEGYQPVAQDRTVMNYLASTLGIVPTLRPVPFVGVHNYSKLELTVEMLERFVELRERTPDFRPEQVPSEMLLKHIDFEKEDKERDDRLGGLYARWVHMRNPPSITTTTTAERTLTRLEMRLASRTSAFARTMLTLRGDFGFNILGSETEQEEREAFRAVQHMRDAYPAYEAKLSPLVFQLLLVKDLVTIVCGFLSPCEQMKTLFQYRAVVDSNVVNMLESHDLLLKMRSSSSSSSSSFAVS